MFVPKCSKYLATFFSIPESVKSPLPPFLTPNPPLLALDPGSAIPRSLPVIVVCPFLCCWCCCCSCNRQWILNQFDRRPYRLPLFDMPTRRHFLKRHALQAVRFFLLITHSLLFLHSDIDDKLLYERPKKDYTGERERKKLRIKCLSDDLLYFCALQARTGGNFRSRTWRHRFDSIRAGNCLPDSFAHKSIIERLAHQSRRRLK